MPFLAVLSDPGMLAGEGVLARFSELIGVSNGRNALFFFAIVFATSALVSGVMRILLAWVNTRYSVEVGAELASSAYSYALKREYEDHVCTNTSEVAIAITTKANIVIFKVILPSLVILNSSILVCALAIAIIYISPAVALIALGCLTLVYVIVFKGVRKMVAADGVTIARESNDVLRIVQEGLGGIRDVLIDGSRSFHVERFAQADRRLRQAQGRNAFLAVVPRYLAESTGIFAIVMIATWYALGSNVGSGIVPVLGALALAAQRLLPLFQQAYAAWTSMQVSMASLQDLLNLFPRYELANSCTEDCPIPEFVKSIEFDQVTFRYRGGETNVVDNVSLVIPKGARVGLIGKSGSGKSTMVDLLMGLLQPKSGAIRVDGVVITGDNRNGWQKLLAHVPQSVFVADRSLAENVSLTRAGEALDERRVRQAVSVAQLDDFVGRLANGIQTNLGERGSKISGGQRQRLGIARALYKNAQVIVFDEATSALDRETESTLVDAIHDISPTVTIVMIAHRYETLKYCDLILEMDAGKINWIGSYQDLLKQKSGEVSDQ